MWVDQRGLLNTTEPSDWTGLLDLSDRDFVILKLTPSDPIHDMLDAVEDEIADAVAACTIDPGEEAAFVERLPDRMALRLTRRIDRVAARVAEQLRRQPLRWRLDYVWALRDCLRTLR